jgi:hypothetical protein
MIENTESSTRRTRVRAALLALLAGGALVAGVAVAPAQAAPYINCSRPVYTGDVYATARCDAASTGKVRFWARCWVGPIPIASKYTSWVTIPAGSYRIIRFQAHDWCSAWGQQWNVTTQIYGA